MKDGMGDKFGMVIRSLSQFLSGLIIGFIKGWELSLVMLSVGPLLAISFAVMIKVDSCIVYLLREGHRHTETQVD